jgi:hypothetical protein
MSAPSTQTAYRALFLGALESGFVNALRAVTDGGWAWGTAGFAKQIEEATRGDASARPSAEAIAQGTATAGAALSDL